MEGSLRRRGATLIELAISLALISIVSAIALPRAARLMDGIHVRGSATEIHSLFSAARHMAIQRSTFVTVEIDTAGNSIILRAGTDTLRRRQLGEVHSVRLGANRPSLTFAPNGVGYGAGNMTITVTRNQRVDSLFISRLGRVRR